MKYLDFFYDIQKEWATEKEVSKICSCSRSDADLILQELEYEAQSRNIKTFKQNNQIYVPMSLFLEYFFIILSPYFLPASLKSFPTL